MTQVPRSRCMVMPAVPRAVAPARRFTRRVLEKWELGSSADTVELLVSELLTNAVNATSAAGEQADGGLPGLNVMPVYLRLSTRGETVVVEVWDTSSTTPRTRAASADDEDGRGLALVQALSKEWGCEVLESGGKVVWCECLIGGQE